MGTLDEIRRMQGEGKSDGEIMQTLKQRGFPDAEVLDGLERAKIKDAVSSNSAGEPLNLSQQPMQKQSEYGAQEVVGGADFSAGYGVQDFNSMQPSMMTSPEQVQAPQQNYSQQYL